VRRLRRWPAGLYYEDCLIEYPYVDEALRRLPEAELVARDQRIKRAFDLSFKKVYLDPEDYTDPVHNNHYYLKDLMEEVRVRLGIMRALLTFLQLGQS
jgi:hypothetical protein